MFSRQRRGQFSESKAAHNERMTDSIDDILREFSELPGTEAEKVAWLRSRLASFTEALALEIESKLVEEPTFMGEQYNSTLREAAAVIRKTGPKAI
jgi:hypothetical protein